MNKDDLIKALQMDSPASTATTGGCQWRCQRGLLRGQQCGSIVVIGSSFCPLHQPTTILPLQSFGAPFRPPTSA